jgi:hypothetical protein
MAGLFGMLFSFTVHAQSNQNITFETHAAFFSKETKQPRLIDPQVLWQIPKRKKKLGHRISCMQLSFVRLLSHLIQGRRFTIKKAFL